MNNMKGCRQPPLPGFHLFAYKDSLSALEGENLTVFLALILIASPVLGFLPFLAALFTILKLPNPATANAPSFFRPFLIRSNTQEIEPSAVFLEPVISATFEIISAFFIDTPSLHFRYP